MDNSGSSLDIQASCQYQELAEFTRETSNTFGFRREYKQWCTGHEQSTIESGDIRVCQKSEQTLEKLGKNKVKARKNPDVEWNKKSRQLYKTMGEYFVYPLTFNLPEGMALSCPQVEQVTAVQSFMKSFENRP